VARGILAEVVIVGRLTGGHGHHLWRRRRRWLCTVWCDVALSRSSWVRASTHLKIPDVPAKNTW
jgi:hypothetical protein